MDQELIIIVILCRDVVTRWKRASDWLVFRLGLLLKEVGAGIPSTDGSRLCNKAKDVYGQSSAPLESV